LISVPGTLPGLILAYREMKSKEQIEKDRQDLAEQKRLADQKMKDLANEMVTTLILIKKFDDLTDDAPPKVKPVDTTGAGDCFVGWLGVGIAEGLNLEDAVRRALKTSHQLGYLAIIVSTTL
jgi:fructose-1-phosphate kinase PfkB-like protein